MPVAIELGRMCRETRKEDTKPVPLKKPACRGLRGPSLRFGGLVAYAAGMIALNPDLDFHRRLERYVLRVGARVVARQTQVSRRTVYYWLDGKMPRDKHRRALEAAIERHETKRGLSS